MLIPINKLHRTQYLAHTNEQIAARRCVAKYTTLPYTCTACADVCLGKQDVKAMVQCIRTNLDCADICITTGRVLSHQTEADTAILRALMQAWAAWHAALRGPCRFLPPLQRILQQGTICAQCIDE